VRSVFDDRCLPSGCETPRPRVHDWWIPPKALESAADARRPDEALFGHLLLVRRPMWPAREI